MPARHISGRQGGTNLQLPDAQALAAAGQPLQELDASLHGKLDDACLQAVGGCQQLRQFTLSRSHKVTAAWVEQLLLQARHTVPGRQQGHPQDTPPAAGCRKHCSNHFPRQVASGICMLQAWVRQRSK